MRTMMIVAAAVSLAACAEPGGEPDIIALEGPRPGFWTIDSVSSGWGCYRPGTSDACSAPAPFAPTPYDLAIGADATVKWINAVDHSAVIDEVTSCLAVKGAREFGHQREPYAVCRLEVNGAPLDDKIATAITWDLDTADACQCGAIFRFVGE